MVAAAQTTSPPGAESRFVITGVPWSAYVALRDGIQGAYVRMTYLRGMLELTSPSELHDESSRIIALLLAVWAEERDVDLRNFGSTTHRREAGMRGAESDECYTIGPKAEGDPPQIAVEVIVANPLIDKLDVYAGLGVGEVWVWRPDPAAFEIHVLDGERYERGSRSGRLPDLDLVLLGSYVRPGESHIALVKAYRAALRAG